MVVDNTDVTPFNETTTIPLEETPQSYAASIVRALSINENSELLLYCCWMSKAQLPYFNLYPTVLGMDVTHGNNSEKQPLFSGVAIFPNKKNNNSIQWIFSIGRGMGIWLGTKNWFATISH